MSLLASRADQEDPPVQNALLTLTYRVNYKYLF
jgi:hypothetical protein